MKRYCTFEVSNLEYEGMLTPQDVAGEIREELRTIHGDDSPELTIHAMMRRNWKVIAAAIHTDTDRHGHDRKHPLFIFILERERTYDRR